MRGTYENISDSVAGIGKPEVVDPDCDTSDPASDAPGITFASEWDATCYRALLARQRKLQTQLEAVEGELNGLLYRAHWSAEAILDREG